ncbi:unnamed protein product [Adineta steineri]|uniref:Uncharacterized protein n=1 Tax=Adineta steineri TaxID=433720 RepID=A0A813Z4B1_9BILA|nr:unnamed protein product [Adineta steineri]CAF0892758.1 unnamed protein product [Adineta steineri]
MEHHKQTIQLSDHVKNKLRLYQPTPMSLSSDELALSDNSDDDVFLGSSTPEGPHRRRSSTFVTYEIRPPSKTQSVPSNKNIHSKVNLSPKSQESCSECQRRENVLHNEHERLLHVYNENRKLNEQLRLATLTNHQYQEENSKLKQHLTKMNTHLKEYQVNYDLLKDKLTLEKINQPKQNIPTDPIKRLRHELQIYNEVIAAKQQKEQEQIDYYSFQSWTPKK